MKVLTGTGFYVQQNNVSASPQSSIDMELTISATLVHCKKTDEEKICILTNSRSVCKQIQYLLITNWGSIL